MDSIDNEVFLNIFFQIYLYEILFFEEIVCRIDDANLKVIGSILISMV